MIAADQVIFITYPGHLLTTAAAITHFRQYHQHDQPIAVVIDDVSTAASAQYWLLAQAIYQPRNCVLYRASIFPVDDIATGWIRQQIIKLSLDLVFPHNTWLCIDGDAMIYADLTAKHIPVRSVYVDDQGIDPAFRRYVNDCGLAYFDSEHWSAPVRTNAVPFRFIDRATLVSLRDYVGQHTKRNFYMLHREWFGASRDQINQTGRLMTEFELIENYSRCILGHKPAILYYDLIKFGGLWQPSKPAVATYWGTDADVADRYFLQHGISESELNRAKLL